MVDCQSTGHLCPMTQPGHTQAPATMISSAYALNFVAIETSEQRVRQKILQMTIPRWKQSLPPIHEPVNISHSYLARKVVTSSDEPCSAPSGRWGTRAMPGLCVCSSVPSAQRIWSVHMERHELSSTLVQRIWITTPSWWGAPSATSPSSSTTPSSLGSSAGRPARASSPRRP